MAIRPVELQATILQSAQTAGVQRQAEVAPQNAAAVTGQQFAAKVEERSETVQETDQLHGNRVEERGPRDQPGSRGKKRQARQPGEPFEGIEGGLGAVTADGDHLIDFMA